MVGGVKVFGVKSLGEVLKHLTGENTLLPHPRLQIENKTFYPFDFGEIKGQELSKRGLTLAAAGGHHVLMVGPPGTGKTMLARALPSILTEISFD